MKYDVLLVGVGGEGILTAGVLIAKAAYYEGHFGRGVQLHGLAQRGGSIPTFVRFGNEKEFFSPSIMQANADLVIALEPMEAVNATYYARKDKTAFVINDYPYMPVYANLLDLPYPSMSDIYARVKPFAKIVQVFNTQKLAKQFFGKAVFGNTMLIGAAAGRGFLPLKKSSLEEAVEETSPRGTNENLKAFEMGYKLGKKKR